MINETGQVGSLAVTTGSAAFRVGDRVRWVCSISDNRYPSDAYIRRQINHELYEVEDVTTGNRTNVLAEEMTLQHGPALVSRLAWESMDAARQAYEARKLAEEALARSKKADEKAARCYAALRECGEAVPLQNTKGEPQPATETNQNAGRLK